MDINKNKIEHDTALSLMLEVNRSCLGDALPEEQLGEFNDMISHVFEHSYRMGFKHGLSTPKE